MVFICSSVVNSLMTIISNLEVLAGTFPAQLQWPTSYKTKASSKQSESSKPPPTIFWTCAVMLTNENISSCACRIISLSINWTSVLASCSAPSKCLLICLSTESMLHFELCKCQFWKFEHTWCNKVLEGKQVKGSPFNLDVIYSSLKHLWEDPKETVTLNQIMFKLCNYK